MNCLGAASAAKVPVKRYKALVAELYVHTAKSTDAEGDLDPSVARGINKLVEYLDRNPHRIPKVSRSLSRHLYVSASVGRMGQ
ncbi:hypothetical protein H632_c4035p0, partial [Helicosporidium sp. ATCC 50920]